MTLTNAQARELRADGDGAANRVAKAIELANVTKAELARVTGLPYTYVTDVASGRFQTITVENAHKFAEAFGVRIEDLFPAREAVA